eukprot:1109616-Rhodomonas_salina.1
MPDPIVCSAPSAASLPARVPCDASCLMPGAALWLRAARGAELRACCPPCPGLTDAVRGAATTHSERARERGEREGGGARSAEGGSEEGSLLRTDRADAFGLGVERGGWAGGQSGRDQGVV